MEFYFPTNLLIGTQLTILGEFQQLAYTLEWVPGNFLKKWIILDSERIEVGEIEQESRLFATYLIRVDKFRFGRVQRQLRQGPHRFKIEMIGADDYFIDAWASKCNFQHKEETVATVKRVVIENGPMDLMVFKKSEENMVGLLAAYAAVRIILGDAT